jgi:hypothetical protein
MLLSIASPDECPSSPAAAARVDYVGFLHRVPFALDAWRLGFAVGRREDYALRQSHYRTLDLPTVILDNDFRNADLKRMIDEVRAARPAVAIIGDAADARAARNLAAVARDLRVAVDVEAVVAVKSSAALAALPRDVIAGYPNGYADVHGADFSTPADWHGRRVHVLGGSPPRTWTTIKRLTGAGAQQRLDDYGSTATDGGSQRANIVGVDWNGLHGVAYRGERWTDESPHWRPADALSVRETVRAGLEAVRRYWRDRAVWPAVDAREQLDAGERPADPRDAVWTCAGCGRDLAPDEVHHTVEYDDAVTRAYCSRPCRDRVEYHDDLTAL